MGRGLQMETADACGGPPKDTVNDNACTCVRVGGAQARVGAAG